MTDAVGQALGQAISYRSLGEGPPILQIHGVGGARVTPAHELLARSHRIIVPELPGFGSTPAHPSVTSAHDLALVMLDFAKGLGLERTAVIGTSFGAKVALWMAILDPARVGPLVLESPAAIRPEGHSLAAIPPAEIPRRAFAHPERITQPPVDPAVRANNLATVDRLIGPNRDSALEDRLPECHVPTLVLFGIKDGLIPPEMGRIYRERMPICHYVLVYEAAHGIQVERPEAFAEVVADFTLHQETFVINRETSVLLPA